MKVARPRGTNDILPVEASRWRRIEGLVHRTCLAHGYGEIRTPVFEHTELFRRGVGSGTDIVEKEMYTFMDRGGRSTTLRPEGTAPVVRAFLENGLGAGPQPVKLYYVNSPMFRYDRPQAGRFRQFHQAGAEVFGAADPAADAEVITLAVDILTGLGLTGLAVRLNSIGCPGCRPAYRESLRAYFEPRVDALCPDCRRRFDQNPLRLLDCKVDREAVAGAPKVADSLCPECVAHFARVRGYLEALGVDFELDPLIVRGLDYYTRTVFEVTYGGLGAQASLCGGGRYDGLVESLGGPPTPAVGFAFGMERLLLTLRQEGAGEGEAPALDVFVAAAGDGDAVRSAALALAARLRREGMAAETDLLGRSLKAQMKHAGRLEARFAAVIGDAELTWGGARLRDLATGEEAEVPLAEVARHVREAEAAAAEETPASS